ncbi:unnamed protein product, partial [Mesorhabditis belari]|uniref:SSD domain-containing protein n=1 Tax=Mesorhabditis belari TaxID=2138241 RepID=A0AAF3EAX2_9BILA
MWDGVSVWVARIVSSYPKICIFVSLAIAAIFTAGLTFAKIETDIRRSFSPHDSDSANEARRYLDFYGLSVYPTRSFILFQTKNPNGNILRPETLDFIKSMDEELMSVLKRVDSSDGFPACHPVCNINYAFQMFLSELQEERAGKKSTIGLRLFDYPRSTLRGAEVFIGLNIYGTKMKNKPFASNSSKIVAANTVILHYFSRFDTPTRIRDYKNLILSLFKRSQLSTNSTSLDFHIFGEEIANHEMVRGAFEAIKLMSIGFVLLFVFVSFVILRTTSKRMTVQLVATTILTPILATVAAFGLQCYMGFPIYSIQCVTPFLVLGIGVDDAFILIHWWNHYKHYRERDVRMKKVLVDVGPSITITSLTNIIAFGVGFLTPTPQMSMFCLCTSIALLLDYIITYSILAPVVYICSPAQEPPIISPQDKSLSPIRQKNNELAEKVFRGYARMAVSSQGKLLSGLFLFALYAFCAIGVFRVRSTFNPSKAFPADSVLVKAVRKIEPVFNQFFPLHIYVSNPPNITNPSEYSSFYSLVHHLEGLPMVYDGNRTVLFLNQYEKFDKQTTQMLSSLFFASEQNHPLTLHNLGPFLDILGNPPTIKYRRPEKSGDEGHLDAFAMTIIAKGMHEWGERAKYEELVRQTLKEYPQFNATLFDADSAVLAVILTTRDDLIGSICLTVACMACVCVLFISNKAGVVIVTAVISSICFCLVGMLSWWGVDMDPVMQVDVLLATGFSVDYTAHIAYQYYQAKGSPEDKIYQSLSEMAIPMLQAGISTFLCMLPLIFIQTYTIVCFAKTIFIVVGCGLYHGLIVLPVLLSFTGKETEKSLPPLIAPTEPLLVSKKNDGN